MEEQKRDNAEIEQAAASLIANAEEETAESPQKPAKRKKRRGRKRGSSGNTR